jgi:hypothetical protein
MADGTHAVGDRAVPGCSTPTRRSSPRSARCHRGRWSSSPACWPTPDSEPCRPRGFGVTVQRRILRTWAARCVSSGGPERISRVNPLDDSLAAGAHLAARTERLPPFNPMTNLGMATGMPNWPASRDPECDVHVVTALELYTNRHGPARPRAGPAGHQHPRQGKSLYHRSGHRRPRQPRPATRRSPPSTAEPCTTPGSYRVASRQHLADASLGPMTRDRETVLYHDST